MLGTNGRLLLIINHTLQALGITNQIELAMSQKAACTINKQAVTNKQPIITVRKVNAEYYDSCLPASSD